MSQEKRYLNGAVFFAQKLRTIRKLGVAVLLVSCIRHVCALIVVSSRQLVVWSPFTGQLFISLDMFLLVRYLLFRTVVLWYFVKEF